MGDYKHWTQDRGLVTQGPEDRGPKDPRTREPGTQGLEPKDIAVLHLAFMTQMHKLKRIRLYIIGVHIVIHTKDTLHTDYAISHYLLAFFILSSLSKTQVYCMQDY